MLAPRAHVLLVASDAALTERLLAQFAQTPPGAGAGEHLRGHMQITLARSAREALARLRRPAGNDLAEAPAVIVLDQTGAGASPTPLGLGEASHSLAQFAPVIVLAAPERASELAALGGLMAEGQVEFVARHESCVGVLTALIERHAAGNAEIPRTPHPLDAESLGETIRHEVNNPLTGILGNAELLLARRDKLPGFAVERLQTIADLAVRLRETIRRLSQGLDASLAARASSATAEPRPDPLVGSLPQR
jgi:signal transduction histidine kinase